MGKNLIERGSWRVTYAKGIGCGDEFPTVPETNGRREGEPIDEGCDQTNSPTDKSGLFLVVHLLPVYYGFVEYVLAQLTDNLAH